MSSALKPVVPSRDPADDGHLGGMLAVVLRKHQLKHENCLPAEVVTYDRDNNVATVQPLIMRVASNGTAISRAPVASVPVLALGGSGFTMTFPLKQGAKGWIHACDRDISLYIQTLNEERPSSFRMHNFSDSYFVPDALRLYTFNSDDSDALSIQSYDGSVRVVLHPATLDLIAPTINLTATESISMQAPQISSTASGANTMTGNTVGINSTGTVGAKFTGPAVQMPDAIINDITQSTHKHTGVTTGSDESGGPTN